MKLNAIPNIGIENCPVKYPMTPIFPRCHMSRLYRFLKIEGCLHLFSLCHLIPGRYKIDIRHHIPAPEAKTSHSTDPRLIEHLSF